jgi:integrase
MLTTGMIRKGLSPRTAAAVRGTLALALKQAEREGKVMRNAAVLARAPKVERPEIEVLDADGVRRLLDATQDSRWHPLWALLATSGLRLGEALGLAWDALDLGPEDGLVRVRGTLTMVETTKWVVGPPKTKRAKRDVPIPAQTSRVLMAWRARQDAEREALVPDHPRGSKRSRPVFTNKLGQRTNPLAADKAFRLAVAAAGLPRCTPHSLRHSYASQLLQAGVPLLVVSRLLGHSQIAVTADTYAHLTVAQMGQASEVMGRLLERTA